MRIDASISDSLYMSEVPSWNGLLQAPRMISDRNFLPGSDTTVVTSVYEALFSQSLSVHAHHFENVDQDLMACDTKSRCGNLRSSLLSLNHNHV